MIFIVGGLIAEAIARFNGVKPVPHPRFYSDSDYDKIGKAYRIGRIIRIAFFVAYTLFVILSIVG